MGGGYLWEFPSKSLMEFSCKLCFVLIALVVVDYTAGMW